MKRIAATFGRGVAVLLPAALTAAVMWWLLDFLEGALGGALKLVLGENLYFPGLGILAGVALVFLTGLVARGWLFDRLKRLLEKPLEKTPLVKSLYGSVKELVDFFSRTRRDEMGTMVTVELPGTGFRLAGMVTRRSFDELPEGFGTEDEVAVYFPMSYQVGGFTVLVPKRSVEPVDLSVEDGLRFLLTAGIGGRGDDDAPARRSRADAKR